ncbi:MAG: hypothetical protein HY928_09970 [Elusimicrobia bacterium]|nr:hypothetical protein [Elusimicrobiota bacterium]
MTKTVAGILLTLPMWVAVFARMGALGGTLHPESWFVIDYALLPAGAVLALVSLALFVSAAVKQPRMEHPWRLASWGLSALGPWGMLLLFQVLWQFSRSP